MNNRIRDMFNETKFKRITITVEKPICRKCGSADNTVKNGFVLSAGRKQRYWCTKCDIRFT